MKSWLWLGVLCWLGVGCGGVAKTGPEMQIQAISANEEGYQYYLQSRWTPAQEKFHEALKLNRLIDRRVGIAANLNNLGVIALETGEAPQAEKYFTEALAVNRELGDASGLCETLNNLGLAYQAQGRLREAEGAYQEALAAALKLPPGPLLALSLSHLGDAARTRRDFDAALSYYHQALAVDDGSKDPRGRAMRWERLGRTFLELKDYGRADIYLKDSLREFRRLEDTNGIVEALQDLTRLALARGHRQEALVNGRLLIELYQSRGQDNEAQKWETLLKSGGGGGSSKQ